MDAIKITSEYLNAAKEALEMAETEMRYAGWGTEAPENVGRKNAYIAICKALHIAEHGYSPEDQKNLVEKMFNEVMPEVKFTDQTR